MHEAAAVPKYIEILGELPKTAVGKIFKPDLRRLAITRIYDAEMRKAGLKATVVEVIEDKKRGLVARVEMGPNLTEDAVNDVLGAHIFKWEPAN